MTVNGISKRNAAPAFVSLKDTNGRSVPADAPSEGEICPLTSGQVNSNPRRHGGGRPKRLPPRVGPSVHGGNWKVKQTKSMNREYGRVIGVAFGDSDDTRIGSEGDTARVVSCRRTVISGPTVAHHHCGRGVPLRATAAARPPSLRAAYHGWAGTPQTASRPSHP